MTTLANDNNIQYCLLYMQKQKAYLFWCKRNSLFWALTTLYETCKILNTLHIYWSLAWVLTSPHCGSDAAEAWEPLVEHWCSNPAAHWNPLRSFWNCCPIGLCFCCCASTTLFWWLSLCGIVWSQGGWFFQLHFSFSRLLWLFGVFSVSLRNLYAGQEATELDIEQQTDSKLGKEYLKYIVTLLI